jgi:hypothetical protein
MQEKLFYVVFVICLFEIRMPALSCWRSCYLPSQIRLGILQKRVAHSRQLCMDLKENKVNTCAFKVLYV